LHPAGKPAASLSGVIRRLRSRACRGAPGCLVLKASNVCLTRASPADRAGEGPRHRPNLSSLKGFSLLFIGFIYVNEILAIKVQIVVFIYLYWKPAFSPPQRRSKQICLNEVTLGA
jgi:hypothetical protein